MVLHPAEPAASRPAVSHRQVTPLRIMFTPWRFR
jgi:hypothetical protein